MGTKNSANNIMCMCMMRTFGNCIMRNLYAVKRRDLIPMTAM